MKSTEQPVTPAEPWMDGTLESPWTRAPKVQVGCVQPMNLSGKRTEQLNISARVLFRDGKLKCPFFGVKS
jgi:hypothetical protein